MRTHRWSTTSIAVLLSAISVYAQRDQAGSSASVVDRIIPLSAGLSAPVEMELPRDELGLLMTACGIANSTRVMMAVELLPPARLPERVERRRVHRPITYEGKSLRAALEAITAAMPQYRWAARAPFVDIRPVGGALSFLDTPIERFDVSGVDMAWALSTLRQIGDPTVVVRPAGGLRSVWTNAGQTPETPAVRARVQAQEDALQKPVSVSVRQTTIRGVLDALVTAHGNGSWGARYIGSEASWSTVRFVFCTEGARIER